jgi:hypothetical protein
VGTIEIFNARGESSSLGLPAVATTHCQLSMGIAQPSLLLPDRPVSETDISVRFRRAFLGRARSIASLCSSHSRQSGYSVLLKDVRSFHPRRTVSKVPLIVWLSLHDRRSSTN